MILTIYKFEDEPKALCSFGPGEHAIGRGTLFQCLDKRISRNHAQFNVTDTNATILAKHEINPCFYKSANTNQITILKYNLPTELSSGDTFGFFPDQYWFVIKLSHGALNNNLETIENVIHNNQINEIIATPHVETNNPELIETHNTELVEPINNHVDTIVQNQTETNSIESSNVELDNYETPCKRPRIESSIHTAVTPPTTSHTAMTSSSHMAVTPAAIHTVVTPPTNNTHQNLQIKEEINIEEEAIIKEEPRSDEECDLNRVKEEDDDACCAKKTTASIRDRCWYGSRCFRKNKDHKDKFSHPGDKDYDSDPDDPRPSCSFGTDCYRRNGPHRREYKHPKQTHATKKQQPVNQQQAQTGTAPCPVAKKKKPAVADVDSEGINPTNIQTTKRPRKKKAPVADSSQDDYDFEDPFLDDGSDDDYEEESEDSGSDWEDNTPVD